MASPDRLQARRAVRFAERLTGAAWRATMVALTVDVGAGVAAILVGDLAAFGPALACALLLGSVAYLLGVSSQQGEW